MRKQNWKLRRLWYLTKYVGAIILLLAVAGLLMIQSNSLFLMLAGKIILSLDIVLLAWMIMTVFDRTLRSKWGFAALFTLIFTMGVFVYSRQMVESMNRIEATTGFGPILEYLYSIDNTLSVFFISFGDYYLEYSTDVWYYIFHFLGYFFAAWVLFSLFGKKLMSRILCSVISSNKKYVFWGYSLSGMALAKDIMRQNEFCQPVFVLSKRSDYDKNTDSKLFDELTEFGAIVVYQDLNEEFNIKGKRYFFITDNQDANVSGALKMTQQVKNETLNPNHKIFIYVRTEIEGVDAMFQALFKDDKELKKKVEMNIYSQSDLMARSFVINHPVLDLAGREYKPAGRRMTVNPDNASVSGECSVLLLGLGSAGYELLRKIVCDAQFLGDDFHFSVTVVDNGFQKNRGRYQRVIDTARRVGIDIIVKTDVAVNSLEFYQWLDENDNILNFDRIIVTLGDDELNTNTAMQLNSFRFSRLSAYNAADANNMPERIFALVKDYRSFSFYKLEGSPIVPFGDFEEINSVDVLIREKLDDIAKLVNYVYCNYDCKELSLQQLSDSDAIESAWDAIDTNLFNQNSSRSVALTVKNTVKIAGGIEAFRVKVKDPYFLERYSEMEHLRWNAFHVMSGIETWHKDDVSNKKGKLLFNGTLAKHICIVKYDELDEITDLVRSLGNVNEDYKESDRRIVRHFPLFYDIMTKK